MMDKSICEKIQQRRLQILVHSCIYYEFDASIISDNQWNSWAKELIELQRKYPQESANVLWFEVFRNFDGSTGMDLPIKDSWVMNKASELLYYKGEILAPKKMQEQVQYYVPTKQPKTLKKTINTTKRGRLF